MGTEKGDLAPFPLQLLDGLFQRFIISLQLPDFGVVFNLHGLKAFYLVGYLLEFVMKNLGLLRLSDNQEITLWIIAVFLVFGSTF